MPRVPWSKGPDLMGFFRKKNRMPINQPGFHRMSLVGIYIYLTGGFIFFKNVHLYLRSYPYLG